MWNNKCWTWKVKWWKNKNETNVDESNFPMCLCLMSDWLHHLKMYFSLFCVSENCFPSLPLYISLFVPLHNDDLSFAAWQTSISLCFWDLKTQCPAAFVGNQKHVCVKLPPPFPSFFHSSFSLSAVDCLLSDSNIVIFVLVCPEHLLPPFRSLLQLMVLLDISAFLFLHVKFS